MRFCCFIFNQTSNFLLLHILSNFTFFAVSYLIKLQILWNVSESTNTTLVYNKTGLLKMQTRFIAVARHFSGNNFASLLTPLPRAVLRAYMTSRLVRYIENNRIDSRFISRSFFIPGFTGVLPLKRSDFFWNVLFSDFHKIYILFRTEIQSFSARQHLNPEKTPFPLKRQI